MTQKAFSLTFSRKNQRIRNILQEKKEEGEIITDYVCKAIDFYEKFKDFNFSRNNNDEVRSMINDSVREILFNSFAGNMIANNSKIERREDKVNPLEEDLDFINTEEDD